LVSVKLNFLNALQKKKINLQVHYIPIFLQPYYKKKFKFQKNSLENSIKFFNEEVSLPIYYSLKKKDLNYITSTIKKILIK
jgi:Predicted pyridoxal phosphate-dependent enzyme apparently involved in regulation of cell wall biogenesis